MTSHGNVVGTFQDAAYAPHGPIFHVSSCGSRVSFISADGVVFRVHTGDGWLGRSFADGDHGVCVPIGDEVRSYDARGDLRWSAAIPELDCAVVDDGVVYAVVAGERGPVLTSRTP